MRLGEAVSAAGIGLALSIAVLSATYAAANTPQEVQAGRVIATQEGDNFHLENQTIGAQWSVSDGKVNGLLVKDRMHRMEFRVRTPFAILLKDGTIYNPDSLKLTSQPTRQELTPHEEASRLADRLHGERFDFPMENSNHSLHIVWSLLLLDGSSYLR